MIRTLGAVLVAGCGIWFGSSQAKKLSQRVLVLEELEAALEQVRRELELRCTPLSRLFGALSGQVSWPAAELFFKCAADLEKGKEVGFAQIWTSLTEDVPYMNQEEKRLFAALGQVLGRYPGPEQGEAIAKVCITLKQRAQEARAECQRLSRVYRAIGAAGGGFLVILLL